jgi:septal ring factor EnvC (AmiA/AmiB activator)
VSVVSFPRPIDHSTNAELRKSPPSSDSDESGAPDTPSKPRGVKKVFAVVSNTTKQLQRSIKNLHSILLTTNAAVDKHQDEIDIIDDSVSNHASKIEQLEDENEAMRRDIEKLKRRVGDVELIGETVGTSSMMMF